MTPTISYGITASTEEEELPCLLNLLQKHKGREDEIVLQFDEGSAPTVFITES